MIESSALRFLSIMVFLGVALPASSGCSLTDEEKIESLLGRLESAVDNHDTAAVSELYLGAVSPVNDFGDSNAIFQMLHLSETDDVSIDNPAVAVIGENAQASFDLSGDMHRNDTLVGRMHVPIAVELELVDGEWRIVAGSESRE